MVGGKKEGNKKEGRKEAKKGGKRKKTREIRKGIEQGRITSRKSFCIASEKLVQILRLLSSHAFTLCMSDPPDSTHSLSEMRLLASSASQVSECIALVSACPVTAAAYLQSTPPERA